MPTERVIFTIEADRYDDIEHHLEKGLPFLAAEDSVYEDVKLSESNVFVFLKVWNGSNGPWAEVGFGKDGLEISVSEPFFTLRGSTVGYDGDIEIVVVIERGE